MKEVNLQGVPVSPVQLDVKQHSNKTLSDLRTLLQTGSTLKGTVADVSKAGDVIFTTTYGKFTMPHLANLANLNKGDKLAFKIEINNDQIRGKIVTINGLAVKKAETIDLKLIENKPESAAVKNQTASTNVDLNAIKLPGNNLKAVISYLNLTGLNKNSVLGRVLTSATNGSEVEFKIIENNTQSLASPYRIQGEVLAREDFKQIIKTPFGILTISNADILPVGKKILLEVKAVGNVHVDNTTLPSKVEDFIFKLNNNLPILKIIGDVKEVKANQFGSVVPTQQSNVSVTTAKNNSSPVSLTLKEQIVGTLNNQDNKLVISTLLQNTEQLTSLMNYLNVNTYGELVTKLNTNLILPDQLGSLLKNDKAKSSQNNINVSSSYNNVDEMEILQDEEIHNARALKSNSIIEKLLGSFEQKEAVQKLSEDFNKIKELFNIGIQEDTNSKWQHFFLPIYDGDRVNRNKIAINKKPNQYIRFIIELSLETFGEMQLDGLIKLRPNSNIPENFDLAVRFRNPMSPEIQKQISEMYSLSQGISGLNGGLNFEQVEEFAIDPSD